jgi:hypothetical protein
MQFSLPDLKDFGTAVFRVCCIEIDGMVPFFG